MLHVSASRSAHRTGPGGLALLVRQAVAPVSGQHRHPSARPRPRPWAREPQRTMHLVMSGLGALIMLGICGLTGFLVVADERHGHRAQAAGVPSTSAPYGIGSRQIDAPLALAEIFPDPEIRLRRGDAPYRITMTHVDTDCHIAATGALGPLLDEHGCHQVVRAAMIAPYGAYEVTAGIFNLADADGAARVGGRIRHLVESGDGSFAAMTAGARPGADPTAEPLSQVGWHERGHYLVYCVITRPDGAAMAVDDPYAARITADLLDSYLDGRIVAARTLDP